MKQINQLTSLRGLAAWWVVLFHFRDALGLPHASLFYRFMEGGYLAVDFFFVLSGFIIYLNYRHTFAHVNAVSLKSFFVRRLARIYPLHLLMMVLYLANPLALILFSKSGQPGGQFEPMYYLASLVLVQNWGFFDALKWNVPAWSISTEFGAYLAFPLIAVLLRRITHSLPLHAVASTVLLLAIPAVFVAAGLASLGDDIPHFGLVRCLLEFALGTLLGSAYAHHYSKIAPYRAAFGWAAALLMVVAIASGFRDYYFAPAVFAAVVIWLSFGASVLATALKHKALVYIGEISYSTYLVHYFVRDWVKFLSAEVGVVQFVVYLLLVGVSSVVLYRYVEMPGRRWVQHKYLPAP